MRLVRRSLLVVSAFAASWPAPVAGQTPYKLPPKDVVAILDAPPPPLATISPSRNAMLLADVRPYPSIELLAEPVLRLAGVRINPRSASIQRTIQFAGFSIQPLDGGDARAIKVPERAGFRPGAWSHDGKKIALTRDVSDGVELWIVDAATGRAKPIPGARLNTVVGDSIAWLKDNRHILVGLVPDGRGPAPPAPRAPVGPNVQESSGRLSQMATFQDLLTSPHDEDLFEHFATGQLARIDSETGAIDRIGRPAMITSAVASPDEKFLSVTTVHRPFSYRVPYVYFARKTEVWDMAGHPVATIAELPISDDIPRQGVPTGPRKSTGSRSTRTGSSGPRPSTAVTRTPKPCTAIRSWRSMHHSAASRLEC